MESGTTRPINRIFTTPLVFNNERLYPLVFPLKVAAVAEWNPVVITSKAQLLTDEAFELVLTGNYTSDVYGCSFWYFIHTLIGGNLEFIDAYPDMKPGEERRFQSRGLFIVVFFKNEKCTEEDTGALDWFERV
ncbi:hypothetical protein Ocin01_18978 [Orchesella cincta]|uniref:Uncharacterized protein n=1 Tax=Orchesella cincta TaxID=48709 RepID=A0A1D2M405_ORCCI|nr:hypothetical protein Ocin01_18978 [Orchesella cincta]